jgi:hypothetical protein
LAQPDFRRVAHVVLIPVLVPWYCPRLPGATSVVCTYPLDLIRARLAVQRQYRKYHGISHAFSTVVKEEVWFVLGQFDLCTGVALYTCAFSPKYCTCVPRSSLLVRTGTVFVVPWHVSHASGHPSVCRSCFFHVSKHEAGGVSFSALMAARLPLTFPHIDSDSWSFGACSWRTDRHSAPWRLSLSPCPSFSASLCLRLSPLFPCRCQFIVDYTGHEPNSLQRLVCGGMAGFVGQSGKSVLFVQAGPCILALLHTRSHAFPT